MPLLAAMFEKMPLDKPTVLGVPLFVWLGAIAVAMWLWFEWQRHRGGDD